MPPRTILLLGCPTADAILQSKDVLLNHILPEFEPAFGPTLGAIRLEEFYGSAPIPTLSTFDPNETAQSRLVHSERSDAVPNSRQDVNKAGNQPAATPLVASWRVLPLKRPELHTGFTQASNLVTPSIYQRLRRNVTILSEPTQVYTPGIAQQENISILPTLDTHVEEDFGSVTFLSTTSIYSHSETSTTAYLDHSFAVHNLPSSQVSVHTSPHESPRRRREDEEEASIYKKLAATRPQLPHIPLSTLTELEDLPTACELVNKPKLSLLSFLVGVIAISEPRAIEIRNPPGRVHLVTLTVGDDTGTGFEIKTWLPISNVQEFKHAQNTGTISNGEGVAQILTLRIGDIVLFEKIGLSIYRDVVSGTTLRNGRSNIKLVYREFAERKPSLSVVGDEQVRKVRKVRDWVRRNIVGIGESGIGNDDNRSVLSTIDTTPATTGPAASTTKRRKKREREAFDDALQKNDVDKKRVNLDRRLMKIKKRKKPSR